VDTHDPIFGVGANAPRISPAELAEYRTSLWPQRKSVAHQPCSCAGENSHPILRGLRRPKERLDPYELLQLVYGLNSCCEDAEWVRVGSVIFHLTEGSAEGLNLFIAWSSRCDKKPDPEVIELQWATYVKHTGFRPGLPTLRRLLTEQGKSFDSILNRERTT
jgi:hypothetical protein